jgi:hypothetical protein
MAATQGVAGEELAEILDDILRCSIGGRLSGHLGNSA